MDDELSGEVDFDFFDEGDRRSPVRNVSKSPLNTTVNGKPPIPLSSKSPASANVSDKHGEDRNSSPVDDYSSDDSSSTHSYSSDSENNENIVNSDVVTSVNARLPSADSGGRKNSPRARRRRRRRKSESDGSSSRRSDSEDSDRGSSSAYSDGQEGEDKNEHSLKPSDIERRKAWGRQSKGKTSQYKTETQSSDSRETRPKSNYNRAVSRKSSSKPQQRVSKSLSDSGSDSYTSDSDSDSSSESHKSNTDSEITDVSPLHSADSSPVMKRKNRKHVSVISAPQREYKPYKELPDTSDVPVQRPAEGTMEFKLLMQAVVELDSEKQKRIKSSTRRVVFAPPNSSFHREKNNYSFSNMQARNIDQENERLLQEIIRKRLPRKKKEQTYTQANPVRRLPNSAVNRLKEQRRIEQENLAFLQRLQNIKPTRGLTKKEQLTEYRRQMQYGVPSGSWRARSPQTPPSTCKSSVRSMSSMSSVQSLASTTTSGSRSRPQSAKKITRDMRPAWDERW
ncbi:cilia- and flagella-associated protein 97-like [Liolophura sinensis]|uniref:cilia- and flagella-associated protein 97-like n=1 Tax=Liolophura sinensis TaxID=3198878 RepID=UPI0031583831